MGRPSAAVLSAALAFLVSGCAAQATPGAGPAAVSPAPQALRLDVAAEGGLLFEEVVVILEGRDGRDQVVYHGPIHGSAAMAGLLPPAGSDLRVLVVAGGDAPVENGRSLSGDCVAPQATVTLGLFPTDPPVARIGIASACAPVPLA